MKHLYFSEIYECLQTMMLVAYKKYTEQSHDCHVTLGFARSHVTMCEY